MDGVEENADEPSLRVIDGEFVGWSSWSGHDPFETLVGPFYSREESDGARCAFRAEPRHMNGMGAMHGGCMLSFADFALFVISKRARGSARAVTVNLNGDFLGPAHVGDLIEGRGEVTRAGASLTFVRGLLTADGRPMLGFSGVLKTVKRRPAPAPNSA